jgi:predicted ATPase
VGKNGRIFVRVVKFLLKFIGVEGNVPCADNKKLPSLISIKRQIVPWIFKMVMERMQLSPL